MAQEKVPAELSNYLRKLGSKGGKARLKVMTSDRRSEIAEKAAAKSVEVRPKMTAAKEAPAQKAAVARRKREQE